MNIKEKYYKETEYLLYNYRMFEISIKNMELEIDYLSKEDGSKGLSYDGIPIGKTNKISSMTEEIALSNSEKIGYLEHSIIRTQSKLNKINKALEGLTETESIVIDQKYIHGKQWWQVGSIVKYSERHCKRIRNNAIEKMAIGIYGDAAIEK